VEIPLRWIDGTSVGVGRRKEEDGQIAIPRSKAKEVMAEMYDVHPGDILKLTRHTTRAGNIISCTYWTTSRGGVNSVTIIPPTQVQNQNSESDAQYNIKAQFGRIAIDIAGNFPESKREQR